MNALVGLELLKKSGDKYALTPESEAFLVSNKPGTLAGFFSMNRVRMMQHWMKLDEIVRTGRPAEARNQEGPGTEFFSELVENIIPMSYGSAQALAEHLKLPMRQTKCAFSTSPRAREFGESPWRKNRRECKSPR